MSDLIEGEPKMPPQISPKDIPREGENNSESEEEEPTAVVFEDSTSSDEDGDDNDEEGEDENQGYVPLSQDENEAQVIEQPLPQAEEQSVEVDSTLVTDYNEENNDNSSESSSSCEPAKMEQSQVDLIRQVMSGITLPSSAIPEWAKAVPEEKWKASLVSSITNRPPAPPDSATKK